LIFGVVGIGECECVGEKASAGLRVAWLPGSLGERKKKKLTDGVNLMKGGNFYLDKIQWLDEGE
jgi:hypothetical protein